MRETKKILTIIVTVAMLATLAIPALAAVTSSGTTNTLRMEQVDGTVKVKNASGRTLTNRDGMRLYSGYEIATEKASYAYFSLDSAKAVKMDASSKGEVFQAGKKLELKLTAGSLFFDVTAPVKAKESLSIRTATMVTGVRGTSGWVEIVDRYTTRFSLLEGELEIVSIDPLTSNKRSIIIVGGQTATVVYHGEMNDYVTDLFVERLTVQKLAEAGVILDMDILGEMIAAGVIPEDATLQELINSGLILDEDALHDLLAQGGMDEETIQKLLESGMLPEDVTIQRLIQEGTIREEHIILDGPGLTVENLQEEDVPGYVAVEVSKNEDLQQRIETTTDLDVEEMIGGAEEKLAEEEASAEAADEIIQEAFDSLTAEDTNPLFEEEEEEEYVYEDSTPVAPPPTTYDLDDPTTAEVLLALADGYTTLNITNANLTQTWDIATTGVPAGITMNVNSGDITVGDGETLEVIGTLNVNSTATLTVDDGGATSGTINVDSANSLNVAGTLVNNGVIAIGDNAPGKLTLSGAATNNGTIYVGFGASGEMIQSGTLTNNGSIVMNDEVNITASAILENNGRLSFGDTGSIINNGTVNNSGDLTIEKAGLFTNLGTYTEKRTDDVYTIVQNETDGTVLWLGVFDDMGDISTTFDGYTIVLGGAAQGTIDRKTVAASNAVLDLNGCTLTGMTNTDQIKVDTSGEFRITDNTGNGKMQMQLVNNGTLTVENVDTASDTPYAVVNYGTMTLNNVDTEALYNLGTLTMNSGSALGTAEAIMNTGGTLNLNGTKVEGGQHGIRSEQSGIVMAKQATITGGIYGITVSEAGSVTLEDSTITGGERVDNGSTAGLHDGYGGANIKLTNCQISAGDYGIWATDTNGYIVLSGGKVTASAGTGISVQTRKQLTVTDTEIIGGSESDGRGISSSNGTVTINSGTVSGARAIHMVDGDINVNGGTIVGHGPGIYIENGTVTVIKGTIRTTNAIASGIIVNNATADISGGTVSGAQGISCSGGTINVGGDVVITGTGANSRGINLDNGTLNMRGGTVQMVDASGSCYAIVSNGTGSITGGKVICNEFIAVGNNGIMEIGGNVEISGGRGVNNSGNGTLTISGGTITANADKGTQAGGGAAVSNSGLLTISDGNFTSTGATSFAVYNDGSGEVNISGGTFTATGNGGNGIYNDDSGTMIISGGNIRFTGSAAGTAGAGIMNSSTGKKENGYSIYITGGTISGTVCSIYNLNGALIGYVDGEVILENGTKSVGGGGIKRIEAEL